MRKTHIIILLITLLFFAIGLVLYSQMPPQMASHWGLQGEVNGYMPKFWGLFLMPIISLAMILLLMLMPKLDPMGKNIEDFRHHYDSFVVLIVSFLFYIYLLTLFWNLGMIFDMNRMMAPAMAILFFCCGILISHAKRNWSVGIRTAWTMSSDYVWDKTHKLGGKLFAIAGAICLLGAILPRYAFLFIMFPLLAAAVISVVYSYIVFLQEKKSSGGVNPKPTPQKPAKRRQANSKKKR